MKNNKRYVKCDMCDATFYNQDDTFVEVRQHTQHQNMAEEIQHLQLLNSCCKRAAAEPTQSLRCIFDTES